jgi:hypothetical protein
VNPPVEAQQTLARHGVRIDELVGGMVHTGRIRDEVRLQRLGARAGRKRQDCQPPKCEQRASDMALSMASVDDVP